MSATERTRDLLARAREERAVPEARARMRLAIGAALALPALAAGGAGEIAAASSASGASAPGVTAATSIGGVGTFVAGVAAGVLATVLVVVAPLAGAPRDTLRSDAGARVALASLAAVARRPDPAQVEASASAREVPPEAASDAATGTSASPQPSRAASAPGRDAGDGITEAPAAMPGASEAPRTSVPASTPSLAEETAALRKAQRALSDGDARVALEVLEDLSWRHPNGVLREERMVAEVAAMCASGKRDAARAVADRLLAEHPSAVGAARVRSSCAFASEEE